LRVYFFPISNSDLASYIATHDIWYQKYVYHQAHKQDLYVPFIGDTKGSKDNDKKNAKKFTKPGGNSLAQKKKAEEEGQDP
jgi:hypothetical protein